MIKVQSANLRPELRSRECKVQNYRGLLFIAMLLCCYVAVLSPSHAKEATPTAEKETTVTEETPSSKETQLDKIRQLKERVATKVAELKEKAKKAYFGEIKEIGKSSILLITKKGEVTITLDEGTKIFRVGLGKKRGESLENLKEGEKILALGISEGEALPAKIIIVKTLPIIINGKVTEVNAKEGIITVQTTKVGSFSVDYETTTNCRIFEKGKGLARSGLSKIEVGDRVHVVAAQSEEENRITALRILVLPGKALGIVGKEEITPTKALTPSPTPEEEKEE